MAASFDWLRDEIRSVGTNGFHSVSGPVGADGDEITRASRFPFPESYRQFVLRFGKAKLYKQVGGYSMGVLDFPERVVSKSGEGLWMFGHYRDAGAYFKEDLLSAGDGSVFESAGGSLCEAADSFEQWLESRSDLVRRHIGKKRWAEILAGPHPFNKEERQIVAARRDFVWKIIGETDEGDSIFEVHNNSDLTLPFLSVGVRSKDGRFGGRVWIPVAAAEPGQTITVTRDCYKEHLSSNEREVYDLPDPGPEERSEYWEFRRMT